MSTLQVAERFSAKELFKLLQEKRAKSPKVRSSKEKSPRNQFIIDWYNNSEVESAIKLPDDMLDHSLKDKDISEYHRTKKLITNDLLRKSDKGEEKPLYKKVEIFIDESYQRTDDGAIIYGDDNKPKVASRDLYLMKIG